jgi:hypothetical protein
MKKITFGILAVSILFGVLTLASCKKDDPGPASGQKNILISKNWKVDRVVKDGVEVTSTFQGLEITFLDDGAYSAINPTPPLWNASGIYEISKANGVSSILIDNSQWMAITEIGPEKLVLTFDYDAPGGRRSGTNGAFTITFIPA